MALIIFENNLKELALVLSENELVYVPSKTNPDSTFGQFSFVKMTPEISPDFNYPTTNLPPKEFLLPPREVLFSQEESAVKSPSPRDQILFGLSYEDLEGVYRLSKNFESIIRDAKFEETYSKTTLIAVDRFSPPPKVNYDLYLQRVGSGICVVHIGSKRGQKIAKNKLFKSQSIRVPRVVKKKDELTENPKLPMIIKKSKNHPVWEELSKICFGCGICSYVCPLCYCFEIDDEIDLTKEKMCSTRCRSWDSCMLQSFGETNVGNARADLSDRIYNWYFHKFVRMPKEQGFSGCVDCNRCVIFCPAKINYRSVLTRIVKDWESKNEKL